MIVKIKNKYKKFAVDPPHPLPWLEQYDGKWMMIGSKYKDAKAEIERYACCNINK